jgi:hypothetical protein
MGRVLIEWGNPATGLASVGEGAKRVAYLGPYAGAVLVWYGRSGGREGRDHFHCCRARDLPVGGDVTNNQPVAEMHSRHSAECSHTDKPSTAQAFATFASV